MYTKRVKARKTNLQSPLHPSNAMQMHFGRCKAIVPVTSLSSFHKRKQQMLSVLADETQGESPIVYLPSLTSCTLKCCP